MAWKPISTAPKDGTHVLLWCDRIEMIELGMWWDGIYHDGCYLGRWETLDGVTLDDTYEPTLWTALPKVPKRPNP